MSKINDIENALVQMEQGRFQKLCNEVLQRDGFDGITAWGAVLGKDKTKKGTPDSYILHETGVYTFIECTTRADGVADKLSEDVEKCFDEAHTGVPPDKVTSVILCHNSRLSPSEVESLRSQCAGHSARLIEFSVDRLALELAHKHRALARDYLGIALDTGQVLDVSEFVVDYQKSKFATRLDNAFLFRENEIHGLTEAIGSADIVVITGKAGVGKTKLALHGCERYITGKEGYRLICIANKNLPLYQDLAEQVAGQDSLLVLVDDANRFDRLTDIINLALSSGENKKIKLILTVRDYAKTSVLESLEEFPGKHVITVGPLQSKEIREILSSDDFGIRNSAFLERISAIAQGNPRLAVMAAKTAIDEQRISALRDASSIYDMYFGTVVRELAEMGDSNLTKVLGIVSFFRIVHRSDSASYSNICHSFGFDELQFWDTVVKLHKLEMVNLFENDIVKISDQVLATYFVYKVFIRDGLLDFAVLLSNFFYSHVELIRDAIIPVVNTFDYKSVCEAIAPKLRTEWDNVHSDETKLFKLMDMFWFALRTEILQKLQEWITAQSIKITKIETIGCDSVEIQDPALKVLQRFALSTEADFKISLGLVLQYFEKNPALFPQVVKYVQEAILFARESHRTDYFVQSHFISELADRANGCEGPLLFVKLFICVGPLFLRGEYDSSWMEDRRAFTICRFNLLPTASVKAIRNTIWSFLFAAHGVAAHRDAVMDILFEYKQHLRQIQVRELVQYDMNAILPHIDTGFDEFVFQEALFVCEYIGDLDDMGFQHSLFTMLDRFSSSYEMKLVEVLENDRRMYRSEMSYQEYEEFQRRRIEEFFSGFDISDYKAVFASCETILRSGRGLNTYQIDIGIYFGLCTLIKGNMDVLLEILKVLLSDGNRFRLRPLILRNMLSSDRTVHARLFTVISSTDYNCQEDWLVTFYESLPENLVDAEYLGKFCDFIHECPLPKLNLTYDFLQKFEKIDPDFLLNTIRTIFTRVRVAGVDVCVFQNLFNPFSKCAKRISSIFSADPALLESIYIHENNVDPFDHDGRIMAIILERNPAFIQSFLKSKMDRKGYLSIHDDVRNYAFLWDLPNHSAIADNLFDFAIRDDDRSFLGSFHYLIGFFPAKSDSGTLQNIISYLRNRIVAYPTDIASLRLCFLVLASRYKLVRHEILQAFLRVNSDYAIFEQLKLEETDGVTHGSLVPIYEEQIRFLESLLDLFDRPELLNHRALVEKRIVAYRERIRYEQRMNFEEGLY